MISAGSAFAADDAALQADDLAADDAVVADTIDEAGDEENVYSTDELILENDVLSVADDLNETVLFAENATYDLPDVLEGRAGYIIGLTSDGYPLSNKVITVNFVENVTNVTTNGIGVAVYTLPDTYTTAGNYTMKIDFAGDDVYAASSTTVTIELVEVETQISAFDNAVYPRVLVKNGYGYYPIELMGSYNLLNISLPVSNKTVSVRFNGKTEEYVTDSFGMVNYFIPNETLSGDYEIEVSYAGGDGYAETSFTTDVAVRDSDTQIVAFNASYPRPVVLEGYGYYPILLNANISVAANGTEFSVIIPLANKTVFVSFNGDEEKLITNELGYVNYTIKDDVAAGNYTVSILFDGEDGYNYSVAETNVEVYDVPTQIFALENMSYPRPLVVAGYGYYPIALTTNLTVKIGNTTIPIDIPLANKTVTINCKGVEDERTTDKYGIINYTIPAEVNPGNGTITITYAGGEGFLETEFSTHIEIYDVPTQIVALEDVSYPRPVVVNDDGIYPIFLTTNMSISVNDSAIPEAISEWLSKYISEIPIYIPLANQAVKIEIGDFADEFTTDKWGYVNFTIPSDLAPDNYTIAITYVPDEDSGYIGTDFETNIEIYDVPAEIYAINNVTYPTPLVREGYGYYPIALISDTLVTLNGTEYNIPFPLRNKTVYIAFNGAAAENFTTDEFGLINYVLDTELEAGEYTFEISFAPDEDEGYIGTTLNTTIYVEDVPTQIVAFEDASYPRPLVMEGYGYYPIVLATDIVIDLNDSAIPEVIAEWLSKYISEIPIYIPLANQAVKIEMGNYADEFTTDNWGYINFTIPSDLDSGNYTIEITYVPDEGSGYIGTDFETNIEIYDVPTKIYAIDNLTYPRVLVINDLAYFPIALTTDVNVTINGTTIPINIPLANKTVYIGLDDNGGFDNFTTNELGVVLYTLPFEAYTGEHTVRIAFLDEDDEGYADSFCNVTVEVVDVDTQIFALDNMSYPRPLVMEGYGYYPIGLTTDIPIPIDINYTIVITDNFTIPIVINTTIPIDIPIANKTISVFFDGVETELETNDYGIATFIIPDDVAAGNYTVEIIFAGADGYRDSKLVTNVEVYDVPTKIYAIDNLTYPRALVINDLAYFPIALTTDTYVTINGTRISVPVPLANKTVYIGLDDGELANFTTDEFGVILYTLPFEAYTGDHTVVMTFSGEDEGYGDSSLNVTVEVVDVDTQIFAVNMSYPTVLVAAGLGYYPIGLTTDIPIPIDINYTIVITDNFTIPIVINTTIPIDIPIANKTISVFFDGVETELETNDYGIATFIIPDDVAAGNYTVEIIFAGADGYRDSKLVTNVEVYDIPTEITALGNLSYPAPIVNSGLGYYPILLTTDLSITLNGTVVPIPIPLENMPVTIEFNGYADEYTTDDYGMVYYVIPKDTPVGNYTMEIAFAGQGGYAASELTTDVEIYDVATKIISPENVTFEASEVTSGEAIFSMFLTTNSTIPIPLINKTVLIDFNGVVEEYTTNWLGMVKYVIPEQAPAGNFTVYMTFDGADGYAASQGMTNVEIIGINTQIIAADNMTVMVKDLDGTKFNLTLVDEFGNVLANKTVAVEFNGVLSEYVTDENGTVFYTLTNGTAGTFTIEMYFKGIDNYTASTTSSELTLVASPSKIYLRNALYFVLQNKIVNVTLWNENNQPVVGKTVYITIGNSTWSGVTDETGTAHIRVGIGFGVHPATVHFDGDGEYAASNRSGFVRVIKETPSVMVRGDNTKFKVGDTKIVKVYLWDRTSKPLPVNSKVAIKVNGQTYIGYTDSQGIASIKIELNKPGTFNAEVKYAGNTAYNAVTRNVKFYIQ